jgi:uncharacterized membrane protein YfhO
VLLFWKVVFWGQVLLPADIIFSDPVWHEVRPDKYFIPQNGLLKDQVSQFFPWHHLAAESMHTYGKIPLWNPYEFSGQPLVANAQSALFYPPNLLLFWLKPTAVANVRGIFNLLLAGVFTFLFCQELKISKTGAIIASLSFMLSGPVVVWLGHSVANVLVCLPLIMWGSEKLVNQKRSLFWGGVTGIGMALSVLGGHPETTFHIGVVSALYFLARLLSCGTPLIQKLRSLLGFVWALALGVLLSSIQLIPFVDFLLQSATLASGGRSMSKESLFFSSEWLYNFLTVVTLLYPNFFGSPADQNYMWRFPIRQNYNEQSIYFGLIPLALAIGGLLSSKSRASTTKSVIIAALAVFCLAVAWRLPGFEVVNHLPIFSISLNQRLKMPFAFLGAVLAGLGLDSLKKHVTSTSIESRSGVYAAGLVLSSIPSILALVVFAKIIIVPMALIPALNRPTVHHVLFEVFSSHNAKTFIPVVTVLFVVAAYLLLYRYRSKPMLFEWALIMIILAELLGLAWGYNPTIEEAEVFPPNNVINILQQEPQPFRIISHGMFTPNYGVVYRIANVVGYDLPVFPAVSDLYRSQGGKGADHHQIWSEAWPLVDWMNIKYIITSEELTSDKFTLLYERPQVRLYKNNKALPRAYMVYQFDVVEDDQLTLKRLTEGTFDFEHRAILSSTLSQRETEQIRASSANNELKPSVDFVTYGNDQVILHVNTRTSGILVTSDLKAPGWRATIDGIEAKMYRANYAFRAVFVPEGDHLVTFFYQPMSFQVGRILSIMGLAMSIVGSLIFYVQNW